MEFEASNELGNHHRSWRSTWARVDYSLGAPSPEGRDGGGHNFVSEDFDATKEQYSRLTEVVGDSCEKECVVAASENPDNITKVLQDNLKLKSEGGLAEDRQNVVLKIDALVHTGVVEALKRTLEKYTFVYSVVPLSVWT